ncbi:MAG: hypothetical protein GY780_04330 [bacterium]|nr:hypothetical protein [bacterium]
MKTMQMKSHKILILTSLLLCCFTANAALADVLNGDFSLGGSDWVTYGDPGLGISFPAAGGVPGGYALLESSFSNPGGTMCMTQTFECGLPGQGSTCSIGFDFFLVPIDAAPGTARLLVTINGVTDTLLPSATGGWEFVSYVVPCGPVVIEFCLVVDPVNNAWQAGIDNVRNECTDVVANDELQWDSLKSIYR